MVYLFRDTDHTRTLVEMTGAEARRAVIETKPTETGAKGVTFTRISGAEAHRWVKSGGHHSTALWIDIDGKVRRAG